MKDSSKQSQRLSLSQSDGEELLLEEELENKDGETVVAADGQGNSLTLLEEYALRKSKSSPSEFVIAFLCAAASLAFAALIYLKTL